MKKPRSFPVLTPTGLALTALLLTGSPPAHAVTAAEPAGSASPAEETRHRLVTVSTSAELSAAMDAATAGDTIELLDGDYTIGALSGKSGTATAPITIRAKNLGRAVVTGGHLSIVDSEHVVIKGLTWKNTVKFDTLGSIGSRHVRLTRNHFAFAPEPSPAPDKSYHWVFISGTDSGHHRVDHNLFENKTLTGNFVDIVGTAPQISQYNRIDHNHFRNAVPQYDEKGKLKNGGEALRVGVSTISESSGYNVIEHNLFEDCDADPEIVSIKSDDNIVRHNTVRHSFGSVTARRGDRNSYYGNFFFGDGKAGSGGIRLYGDDQRVYNNYFEGLTGTGFNAALQLGGGDIGYDADPTDKDAWSKHWPVRRARIVHNTFVDNVSNFEIASDYTRYNYPPVDSLIADNIVVGSQGELFKEALVPVNQTYAGNIAHPTGTAVVGVSAPPSAIRVADPRLTNASGLYRLGDGSPAIDAASRRYPYVHADMDGQARPRPDVGADERSGAPVRRRPLDAADVGVNAP
ncbi:polysaccharide lyase 6 family protein [Streptomyces sp. TRM68416]|uniref:polysaccharide lyase 6 family protein n=1 Tax=Streptomyces sp. TRM68416 TaxID=2758412 RepID=UPI001661E019|nr:polysaccharide lyase 6 family protein [Streptomyces sp. TRM68416]MBD0841491.1 lyase [Streptomyces sp. TRM68416]